MMHELIQKYRRVVRQEHEYRRPCDEQPRWSGRQLCTLARHELPVRNTRMGDDGRPSSEYESLMSPWRFRDFHDEDL
ncbi:MAG: hypothetical protein QOE20_2402, partial [Mycobacterium sp.]|nr:hypothetical protein [Mycobacterium sp.]